MQSPEPQFEERDNITSELILSLEEMLESKCSLLIIILLLVYQIKIKIIIIFFY